LLIIIFPIVTVFVWCNEVLLRNQGARKVGTWKFNLWHANSCTYNSILLCHSS